MLEQKVAPKLQLPPSKLASMIPKDILSCLVLPSSPALLDVEVTLYHCTVMHSGQIGGWIIKKVHYHG